MSGLGRSVYYVEVDVANKDRDKIDLPGVEAYFYGKDGDILLVRAVRPGELQPSKKATFHLDTNGYTSWLLMSFKNRGTPVTLCISLKSDGKVVSSFATNLPPYGEFRPHKSLPLNFVPTDCIPNVDVLQPARAEELRIPGAFGIGAPATVRKQGDETAVYVYYRRSRVEK